MTCHLKPGDPGKLVGKVSKAQELMVQFPV